MAADWHWSIWNRAVDTVRDGESAATAALGKPFFDWVHEDRPDAGALFDGAMRSLSFGGRSAGREGGRARQRPDPIEHRPFE